MFYKAAGQQGIACLLLTPLSMTRSSGGPPPPPPPDLTNGRPTLRDTGSAALAIESFSGSGSGNGHVSGSNMAGADVGAGGGAANGRGVPTDGTTGSAEEARPPPLHSLTLVSAVLLGPCPLLAKGVVGCPLACARVMLRPPPLPSPARSTHPNALLIMGTTRPCRRA